MSEPASSDLQDEDITETVRIEASGDDTLVLLAGQSNALGFGNSGPAPYTPTERVQIWTGTEFNYLNPGVNTGTPANPGVWGPEVAFAKAWLQEHAEGTLYIGKVAKGSTGLAQDAGAEDWSPHSDGELFDAAAKVSHDMRANLGTESLDGVLWMQGETDATDEAKAGAYLANLREFVAEARQEWAAREVVMGRIGDLPAHSEQVRVSQWALDQDDDHLISFRTLDYQMQSDGLHYASDGFLAMGRAFFDGWSTISP